MLWIHCKGKMTSHKQVTAAGANLGVALHLHLARSESCCCGQAYLGVGQGGMRGASLPQEEQQDQNSFLEAAIPAPIGDLLSQHCLRRRLIDMTLDHSIL